MIKENITLSISMKVWDWAGNQFRTLESVIRLDNQLRFGQDGMS